MTYNVIALQFKVASLKFPLQLVVVVVVVLAVGERISAEWYGKVLEAPHVAVWDSRSALDLKRLKATLCN